jgi:hypothetical protein
MDHGAAMEHGGWRREAPFSACHSRSEPISHTPGRQFASRGDNPRRQISPPSIYQAEPLHATPKSEVLATRCFSRAGGFSKLPATAPPVCIPFAGAFQRLLTAHGKPGLCVVCLRPLAIGLFSAIAHSTSSVLGLLSVFTSVSVVSRPVLFNVLGVALAA